MKHVASESEVILASVRNSFMSIIPAMFMFLGIAFFLSEYMSVELMLASKASIMMAAVWSSFVVGSETRKTYRQMSRTDLELDPFYTQFRVYLHVLMLVTSVGVFLGPSDTGAAIWCIGTVLYLLSDMYTYVVYRQCLKGAK